MPRDHNQKIDALTHIIVKGAREHNLKGVDIALPRNKLVVVTGLSGSGKSSLAFDTIYAEGQRRYVESLSAYARQFLELMQKPDVDSIEGLSPAISIEQKTTSRNPRSTVGTVTEIYDYMRLLWARVGIPYSPATGEPITSQSVAEMVDRTMALPIGSRFYILAPMIRGRKGEYRKEFELLRKRGFARVKVDGEFYDLDDPPSLDKKFKHDIDVVVDRMMLREDSASRLAESFETALSLADGIIVVEMAGAAEEKDGAEPEQHVFSQRFACPVSGFSIPEIEPRLFSFNNPFGACPACDGLGRQASFDEDLIVPDKNLSLQNGALAPWSKSSSVYYAHMLEGLAKHYKFSLSTPWKKLSRKLRNVVLHGSGTTVVEMLFEDGERSYLRKKPFEGLIPNMSRRFRDTDSQWIRDEFSKYQSERRCTECEGFRVKDQARAVKIAGRHIGEAGLLSIRDAQRWFSGLPELLSDKQMEIAQRILKEINDRLSFLCDVGLDYLTLSRESGGLSGGESQRIRLASQIGSGLTGVLYVLDEPSIGLHQRDNSRLLTTLQNLRDLGNSVLVVEHDEEAILSADYVVDMGPRAGLHGGEVVAFGSPEEISANKKSLTGAYLRGDKLIRPDGTIRKGEKQKTLSLIGATGNNLKNLRVDVPLGLFVCVTGVSGGGKSTLIMETLYKALARALHKSTKMPAPYDRIEGLELLDKIIDIDQSPIGRTPRSNPATYTGAFTHIRDWFAGLPESKARGYKPGRFSFNVKGGRCENCQGDGLVKIEMHFLPDVFVTCDSCKGKRYNRETLEVTYKGHSIADILDMSVEDAAEFFKAVPPIRDKMRTLQRVGLGYVKVGQQATTLSGGEAQRVKLAKELSKRATGRTLYILDEPTTGLHFEDVNKLLEVLHELVDQGNSIIVIEHNLDVIKTADWIIDLGPDGGDGGGEIVATGTPQKVAQQKKSWTGRYLAEQFEKDKKRAGK